LKDNAYRVVRTYVHKYGLNQKLPEHYKRRDPDEPRADEKEKLEDKLALIVRRRFREVLERLEQRLQVILPRRKHTVKQDVDDWLQMLEEQALTATGHEKEMLNTFITAAQNGINLFRDEIGFDIDWTVVNDKAAAWAREYSTEWLEGLKETERKRIRSELANFVEQEGYTIGDVIDGLKESGFDDVRSQHIATTEITRAYGESAEIGARQLQEQYPDVEVIKTWFTNRDGLVCPICAPLDGDTVSAREGFGASPGIQSPPAHPNCRCWMNYRTTFLGEAERGEFLPRE